MLNIIVRWEREFSVQYWIAKHQNHVNNENHKTELVLIKFCMDANLNPSVKFLRLVHIWGPIGRLPDQFRWTRIQLQHSLLARFVLGLSNKINSFSNFYSTLRIVCSVDRSWSTFIYLNIVFTCTVSPLFDSKILKYQLHHLL